MKTTLPKKSKSHEPAIFGIRDIILENYKDKISHIILFGSFARGNWVYDYYREDGHDLEYASDYDFLVLTKKAKNGSGVQACRFVHEIDKKLETFFHPYKPHKPTVIVESYKRMNEKLEKGQYFFSDIKKEGILLFQEEGFELSEAKELTNEEIKIEAEGDFKHWFKKGSNFLKGTNFYLKEKMLNEAAFSLHQTTESFFNTSLLVLTGYKPKTHDLETLLSLCSSQSNKFLNIFPLFKEEQKEAFELLRKAYVDARYRKDYKISLDQLTYLIEKVDKLKEVTEEVCKNRIKSLS